MSIAVLVSSCDKYSFTWKGFAHGFKKYWPDCPYPVYFMTNELEAPVGETIKTFHGKDFGWISSMKYIVRQLKNKEISTIVFLLDDYWLTAPTDTKNIIQFSKLVYYRVLNYIRLIPSTDANLVTLHQKLSQYQPNAQYPNSLNASIWNLNYFENIIHAVSRMYKTDIWDVDSSKFGVTGHVAVKNWSYIHYIHPDDPMFKWKDSGAATHGALTPSAYEYAQKEGFTI